MTSAAQSTLGQKLIDALRPIFDNAEPIFVSDSDELVAQLESVGCATVSFAAADSLTSTEKEAVVAIPTDSRSIAPYKKWDRLFGESRMLVLPLDSFDSSPRASGYALELLESSSFADAVVRNDAWLDLLLKRQEPLTLHGPSTSLICRIDDGVMVMSPRTRVMLDAGEWDSIGSYFEVGMVAHPDDVRPAFVVDGFLEVPGVAVAHHRQMRDELRPLASEAWRLFERLHAHAQFPLSVEIRRSRIVSIRAGDLDLAEQVERLTNERLELSLTEMSFSTNSGLTPESIDWTVNSQLNEGALGIHVAAGDGLTGAHIDFICPGAALKEPPTASLLRSFSDSADPGDQTN